MSRLNLNPYKNKNYYRIEKLINESFIKLLTTSRIEDINIKKICIEADVNRTTFYDHYANIDAIFNKLYDSAYNSIISPLKSEEKLKVLFANPSNELLKFINSLSNYDKKIINCILNSSYSIVIAEKATNYFTEVLAKRNNITSNNKLIKIKTVLLGFFYHIFYSIDRKDYKYKFDEMVKSISNLLKDIIVSNE